MHKICLPRSATSRVLALRPNFRAFDSIKPLNAAHIVINMQNAFLAPHQPLEIPTAREIVPNINKISKALRAAAGRVVYVQNSADGAEAKTSSNYWSFSADAHDRIRAFFSVGSQTHALWPALALDPRDLKVPKRHFSALSLESSPLHVALRTLQIDTLIITGAPTNICCESTARDALSLGYKVIFVCDATAALDDSEHNAALGNMLVMSADVMCTNEVLLLIDQCASRESPPIVPVGVFHHDGPIKIPTEQANQGGE